MPAKYLEKLTKLREKKGGPFKVLIVDDEQWVREVFRDFCTMTDIFEVDLADSGAEAIEKARTGIYDLITMDLIMPEMSGLDAMSQIKQASPKVPIMVITGNATDKLVNEAGVLGACRVMYKPVMLEDFISEVTETLMK